MEGRGLAKALRAGHNCCAMTTVLCALGYNLVLAGVGWQLLRRADVARVSEVVGRLLLWLAVAAFVGVGLARAIGWNVFGGVSLWACVLFGQLPLAVSWLSRRAFRAGLRGRAWVGVVAVVLIAGVALEAFGLGPRRLEVNHHVITSSKLRSPLRIVLLADVQTDDVGSYEAEVFERVRALEPDLVLFAGDYVQVFRRHAKWRADAFAALRKLVASLEPRLGMVAVQGDVDAGDWVDVFAGTPAVLLEDTRTVELGELAITGLSNADSESGAASIPRLDRFHIVLGHHPDFALSTVPADLLLAGHSHGGQVRLPWIGPLVTLSRVPNAWTEGLHVVGEGANLIVSRGIGMERLHAPRLRFLCPPEIVVIELRPHQAG